ncbi:MAG: biotin transporter BioY [Oscillospiraceae bacterium]|nr:biotin transporter BioY [Oscillospiraceae bacterium]
MKRTEKTKKMARCALFAAVIAVVAPFTVPLGTIPVSLASLAVMLAGVILPPAQAVAAVGTYLFCGAIGLPVFSGAQGGLSVFLGPTGGYLWGYLLCAFVTAFLSRQKNRSFLLCALGAFAGAVLSCLCGAVYYMLLSKVSFGTALGVCVFPFLPMEAAKAALAAALGRSIRRALSYS